MYQKLHMFKYASIFSIITSLFLAGSLICGFLLYKAIMGYYDQIFTQGEAILYACLSTLGIIAVITLFIFSILYISEKMGPGRSYQEFLAGS